MIRLSDIGHVIGTDFEGADYVLIDIIQGETKIRDVVYDYRGVSVSAILLGHYGKTYVYVKLDQHIVARHTDISAMIAAHFAGYPMYYNSPTSLDNINLYIEKLIKTKKK